MSCPAVGPCNPYELTLEDCCLVACTAPDPCLADGGNIVPQIVVNNSVLAASQFIWAATGRQFGCCQVTIRPCRRHDCSDECCLPFDDFYGGGYAFPWFPVHQANGSWINVSCDCKDQCSCNKLCEISLPYPTCSVDEVRVDGVILDPSEYLIHDFKTLVRIGDECWPECNDFTKPDTEVGTWSVKLTYGRPVPELVRRAAAEFACQLIRSCVGAPCNLPQRISSITRQGISVSFLDPMDFLDKGKTGIYLVDLAIKAYNPNHLQNRALVYSPDVANKWKVETWRNGDPIGPQCS